MLETETNGNGDVHTEANETKEADSADGTDNAIRVDTTYLFIGVLVQHKGPGKQTLDLQWPCNDFYDLCRSWAQYDEDVFSVSLNMLRGYQLPDFVFEEGEEKPKKAKRKAQAVSSDTKRPKH